MFAHLEICLQRLGVGILATPWAEYISAWDNLVSIYHESFVCQGVQGPDEQPHLQHNWLCKVLLQLVKWLLSFKELWHLQVELHSSMLDAAATAVSLAWRAVSVKITNIPKICAPLGRGCRCLKELGH